MFGEIETNISFGDYGGDSDASLDQHSVARRVVIQHDTESYLNTDTDIDPMDAGMDQWDSDGQYDVRLEDPDFDEAVDNNHTMQHLQQSRHIGQNVLIEQESEDGVLTWRMSVNQRASMTNLMADMEVREIRTPFVGNPDDRQFEMLLEQFAEDNNSTRGAPPAATSFIENLPSVVISTNHETSGGVICPVCKDPMHIRARAKQLPCMHLYHSSCILLWLSCRNTCPVCWYELPTDDPVYERSMRATANERDDHGLEHTHLQETIEEISNEPEDEGTYYTTTSGAVEGPNTSEHTVHGAEQPNGARRCSRWLFIAAAPVASLVTLALVLCFTNPASSSRRQLCRRPQSATVSHVDMKRSWWSMF